MSEQAFYYVIEHETNIVRAAQSTLRGAMNYTTPENCHTRFIVGPLTSDQLHKVWNALTKTALREDL